MGTDAFSPQWAESFRYILLLPSPPLACHRRKPKNFESALERVRRSFRVQFYGYVVMTEHVHLLLSEPQRDTSSDRSAPLKPKAGLNGPPVLLSEPQQDTLADALKSLKQRVSRRLIGTLPPSQRRAWMGHPSISGKSGTTISTFEITPQFVEKLRYIHRNPVKAGLCERPEDWEWSSFRYYATGCEGRVEIESEWTARKRERAAGRLCPAVELPHSSQKTA